jgi:hypothetical protein
MHPFHPLTGQRLEVLFDKRRGDGVVLVCSNGSGGQVTLAQSWTDRGQPAAAGRLSVQGLTALRALVSAMGRS